MLISWTVTEPGASAPAPGGHVVIEIVFIINMCYTVNVMFPSNQFYGAPNERPITS